MLRSSRRYWLPGVLAALVAVYLASGFYVVEADERAVVRRFGAVAAQVGPGMHYRLPWPVDWVPTITSTAPSRTLTSTRSCGAPTGDSM